MCAWVKADNRVAEMLRITTRQLEIYRRIANGEERRDICFVLDIKMNTLKTHLAHVSKRLRLHPPAKRTTAAGTIALLFRAGALYWVDEENRRISPPAITTEHQKAGRTRRSQPIVGKYNWKALAKNQITYPEAVLLRMLKSGNTLVESANSMDVNVSEARTYLRSAANKLGLDWRKRVTQASLIGAVCKKIDEKQLLN